MNAAIISKVKVKDSVLDDLARELPAIIAADLEVPGGRLARVRPEEVSLEFSRASLRDVGADIRIMVFARRNEPRVLTENERAKAIMEKVIALTAMSGEEYSVDVRLYLVEIGVAVHHVEIHAGNGPEL